jgi:predicted RNase H-like nuclease
MSAVLGIDAAWTAGQPSGVALAVRAGTRWRLRAVAPSYTHFLGRAAGAEPDERPRGSLPDASALLAAAGTLAGARVDLVAIDMPLARTPIVGRRVSDNAITRAFGGRYCGTHSPSAARPGPLSDRLRAGFAAAGYPLRTGDARAGGLIEVYPHPALVVLAQARRRLPYKASKTRSYWPAETLAARRVLLAAEWARIVALLATRIDGVAEALPALPADAGGVARKAQEDMIDAVVCAWVGIAALEGAAEPFGDADSAIWVPREQGTAAAPAG